MVHLIRLYRMCRRTTGRTLIAAAIPLSLALILLVGCTPLPMPYGEPPRVSTPELRASSDSAEPCEPPDVDVEVVHAVWAYVHERYPTQPWPNRAYLVGDHSAAPPCENQPMHVVLCSHATGFTWEGEALWRLDCECCRVQVEEIHEVFVAVSTEVTDPSEHH